MTLKEKIGQLFMFGFHGRSPGKAIERFIKEFHVGGVIVFSRNLQNPAQTAKLTNALQAATPKMPLFIAVDQEGGRVSRLPKGFTIFPSSARVASGHSAPLVYQAAEITAKELRAVGINMNFAPVLDIDTNPDNPIIGDRAFGSDHETVSTMGLTALAGLQDNRVVACGKHFPGHGDTSADSHNELPEVGHTLQRLGDIELRPFVHGIQNGLASIMTAHVMYPKVDPDNPATLSPKIIKGILRNQFRFKGVVVTDDMEMRAITDK
ncbi:MAG TPA: beta-N-acetylhexosaminidase, partial [Nitrospiria bacterium]|nr:beta-N-acetylhexosaminidase [Nitrospiria bacterium]